MKTGIFTFAVITLLSTTVAFSRPPGPPQEALKACNGKSAGAQVQFTTPNGHVIKATCRLIAVPQGGQRPMGKGPNHPDMSQTNDSHGRP